MSTSHKVIESLFLNKDLVRVGLSGGPWAETLTLWMDQGYPTRKVYYAVGDKRPCYDPRDAIRDGQLTVTAAAGEYEEPVSIVDYFSEDSTGVGPRMDADPIAGLGSGLTDGDLIEETEEWAIRRNGAGATLRWWKHRGGTPEHLAHDMVSRDIWERTYRPHLLDLDPSRIELDEMRKNLAAARETNRWVTMNHEFVWERSRQCLGDLTLYQSLLLDPEWIHDFNRVYTDFYRAHWGHIFDQVGLPDCVVLCDDLGYNAGTFASPGTLETLVFPYFVEIVDFFHSRGVMAELHTCGSTAAVMPQIVSAGFDAVNPMERKALGNDPFFFAEEYGDAIVLHGAMDMRVLETNDLEIIGREVADLVDGMKARGARFIFSPDHGITPRVNYASWLHAVETFREHMWY